MSISGYAELMMNGMVPADHIREFSGRIYHESIRLSNLVADIIQLSRLDESNSEVPFEEVDLYELAEDVRNNLRHPAGKKNIFLELAGSADDGIGIPKSEQGRIFERFYRVDKSHSRQTGGTGLGLSIVKHGATLHHAQINVESEQGVGTRMEIVFPENTSDRK